MEVDHQWNTTFEGIQPFKEEDLPRKTTFDGRQPSMEDDGDLRALRLRDKDTHFRPKSFFDPNLFQTVNFFAPKLFSHQNLYLET